MVRFLFGKVGTRLAHAAAAKHLSGSRLSAKLGIALFRDRRVPAWSKLLALAIGGALTAATVALELISVEALLAALLPAIGLVLDMVTDGLEVVILPFVLGALVLPFLAPRPLVDKIMIERSDALSPPLPPGSR